MITRILLASALVASACTTDALVESTVADEGDGQAIDDVDALAAGVAITWPRVAQGDYNQDVTTVQYLLNQAGRAVALDGRFGAGTDAAVRAHQGAKGLIADGIVGEQTWLSLVVEVQAGSSGKAVEAVQYLLRNRYGASLDVTGQFGPTTEDRVLAFQKSVCLGETGVVGRYTWNALIARRSFCTGTTGGGAAQRLLDHDAAGRIELWDQTFGKYDGADPKSNIRDTAAGKAAKTSCYGTAPCTTVRLATGLVNGMAALREQYGYSYFVTAISGASHSATSYHYAGRAVDFGEINGVVVSGDSALARGFMQACRNLGAIEVLGPSNDANHQDHVHCAW